MTKELFGSIGEFDVYISELTLAEIEATPDATLRDSMRETVEDFTVVGGSEDVEHAAQILIANDAVPVTFLEDAYHVAFALVHEADFLLSWNFKHIVRRKTKDIVRMIISRSGYKHMENIAPPELL